MHLLGVKKVQICPFKGTAPATSCCTPKDTILNPYCFVCTVYKNVLKSLRKGKASHMSPMYIPGLTSSR